MEEVVVSGVALDRDEAKLTLQRARPPGRRRAALRADRRAPTSSST
jgi:hypothetical protein